MMILYVCLMVREPEGHVDNFNPAVYLIIYIGISLLALVPTGIRSIRACWINRSADALSIPFLALVAVFIFCEICFPFLFLKYLW